MPYIFRISLGYFLLLLGVAAFAVPVLPSSIFLALGALILSGDTPLFARFVCRVEHRFPYARRFFGRIRIFLGRHGFPPLSCRPEE